MERSMRLSLVKKADLTAEQSAYLQERLDLDIHRHDGGPSQVWNRYVYGLFAFLEKESNRPVAIVECSAADEVRPGWWIDSDYRGKGYGAEVVDLLAQHLMGIGVKSVGPIPIQTQLGVYDAQSSILAKRFRNHFDKSPIVNFSEFTDVQVLDYLCEHFHEIEAGDPPNDFPDEIKRGIKTGDLAVEKKVGAFAILARANRKSPIKFVRIAPESDLLFLYVAPDQRGTGFGSLFLEELKSKYMEEQEMELICAGERRKAFFEKAGFVCRNMTTQGLYHMWCSPQM